MKKPSVIITETKTGKRTAKLADDLHEGKELYRATYKKPGAGVVKVYLLSQYGLQSRKVQSLPKPAASGKKVRAEVE